MVTWFHFSEGDGISAWTEADTRLPAYLQSGILKYASRPFYSDASYVGV